jgi:hypothetical protein
MPTKSSEVSEAVLIKRINRKLARRGEFLKVNRDPSCERELGTFYRVNLQPEQVLQTDVDLETIAREERVIREGEAVKA